MGYEPEVDSDALPMRGNALCWAIRARVRRVAESMVYCIFSVGDVFSVPFALTSNQCLQD